jgi:hypothetical protein
MHRAQCHSSCCPFIVAAHPPGNHWASFTVSHWVSMTVVGGTHTWGKTGSCGWSARAEFRRLQCCSPGHVMLVYGTYTYIDCMAARSHVDGVTLMSW